MYNSNVIIKSARGKATILHFLDGEIKRQRFEKPSNRPYFPIFIPFQ